ncbi:hypothetical protein [Alteribacillus sp. HJP-4]|uniref:hypothetical protein n=1 Tax=Alteribacillus sp. HJP-4 TaxID=2775394 RepID=UPI0035CD0C9F
MEKQKYYVNLNPISMDEVSPVRIPDSNLIQYEIEVTPDELEEVLFLLGEVQDHDVERQNLFTFRHFNEALTETDRHEYQDGLDKVFQMIYKYGSAETKKQVESIHLINDKPKRNMKHIPQSPRTD